jgi:hypothetical protein
LFIFWCFYSVLLQWASGLVAKTSNIAWSFTGFLMSTYLHRMGKWLFTSWI